MCIYFVLRYALNLYLILFFADCETTTHLNAYVLYQHNTLEREKVYQQKLRMI